MGSTDSVYKFVKAEDYFASCRRWESLGAVQDAHYENGGYSISLRFKRRDGTVCVMLIQAAAGNTVRMRFNPGKTSGDDYLAVNTRSVIMDTFKGLRESWQKADPFTTECDENADPLRLLVKNKDGKPALEIVVQRDPFGITIARFRENRRIVVLETAGVYFAPNGDGDFSIVQAFKKPPDAKYTGFGEQGGLDLCRNSTQLNYFNFDNMRYRQVYNRGPLECREPLYHSDPFFMEFDGNPAENLVNGMFVDNPSQVLMDIGYSHSGEYLIGTRFWDSDLYFFTGGGAQEVMRTFMSFIGTPKLKPRYALGYHQGCYGWETRADVENAVDGYRQHGIPLDGIHIDVDIQNQYQTFTIDEGKFPNPKEMFANLARRGIKCSTNITPIISSRDPGYQTYRDGEAKGYFVKDRRTHLEDGHAWQGQDFEGGNERYFDLADPERINSGESYTGEVYYGGDRGTTGHYADLNRREVRRWWGEQYRYLFECGLEMVWQDMTTPCIRNNRGDMRGMPFRLLVSQDYYSDAEGKKPQEVEALKVWNLYSYNLHKATYHGLNRLPGRENKRNFIVGRGSFTGMHRFAALWTGDNASEWDFLKINVAQVLSLGMSGQAMSGQDIGGFERQSDDQGWADPELLIRWTAAGAFLPWFRNHYIGEKKGAKHFQEPYQYQYVNLDAALVPPEGRYIYGCVLPVCKYYIELRYRLMQLFYDALFENAVNGMPICRPLFLCCGEDKTLYNDKTAFLSNEFFVREDLLIAPVLDKQGPENGGGKRDVYLPQGSNWYAYMDNKRPLLEAVEGGVTVRDYNAYISADEGHIGFIVPMYVREGAVIPLLEAEQYVGEFHDQGRPHPLTFAIYPGSSGAYTCYLDDGVSRSSAPVIAADNAGAKQEYRAVEIRHGYADKQERQISVTRIWDKYTPKYETYYYLAVLHDPRELAAGACPVGVVKLDKKTVPFIEGGLDALKQSAPDNWAFDAQAGITYIKVEDNKSERLAVLNYRGV